MENTKDYSLEKHPSGKFLGVHKHFYLLRSGNTNFLAFFDDGIL